ncbi:response regulator transcription factor [Paucibacter sp. APW11]|uniref:Response regulator transcription factor n=1 Tax=Roseateles aquae TaxID=3077235 RepID=A0ABU3PDL7_9BURK|nr:response regulator transcription factor [Paucibacter sp. APW11]MDT9000659.1 response regulator transcription factor [Paucibacter sp. APW11]
MWRVMLVEDDQKLAELVRDYLGAYEFAVEIVARGDEALERFAASQPDLVILDLSLPGLDGLVVCRQIRERSAVPLLILTAREDAFDEVSGLEQGADDYINKPVQPRVLLARLRALVRRAAPVAGAPARRDIVVGRLRVSRENHAVYWRDAEVELNQPEFKLMLALAESAGQVMSRNELLLRMRGLEFDGLDRSIDNSVSRLRRKFDDAHAERIKTVWGEGYLLSPSAWE